MNKIIDLTTLNDDLYFHVVSFVGRYKPTLNMITHDGCDSDKLSTVLIIDEAFHMACHEFHYNLSNDVRKFFLEIMNKSTLSFMFHSDARVETLSIYGAFRLTLLKKTLCIEIENRANARLQIRNSYRIAVSQCTAHIRAKDLHFVNMFFICEQISELNTSNIMRDCAIDAISESYPPRRRVYVSRYSTKTNIFGDVVRQRNVRCRSEAFYHRINSNYSVKRYKSLLQRDLRRELAERDGFHTQSDDGAPHDFDEGLDFLNANPQNDVIWHGIESILLFLDDIYRVKSLKQVPTACLRLVKMVCHGSVLTKVLNSKYYMDAIQHMTTEAQGFEENLDSFRDMMDFMTHFKKTELFKKVYKLCMYLLTFSIFENMGLTFSLFGYTKFEEEVLKKKYYNRNKFLFVLMDSLSFLMKRGLQIIQTGRVDVLFHSGETYTKWFDHVQLLQQRSLLLANPEAHGFDEFSFRAELDDAIEKGECIKVVAGDNNSMEKKIVTNLVNSLKSIRFDLTTKSASKERRDCPFSILISGDSGCGKSTLKDMLRFHYAKVQNLSTDDRFVFTKNPVAEYWDGFTTDQFIVILDDVAFMAPNAANGGDPSCMEFLQIINAVPYVPNQAALEDKGRTPLRAKLVIATTNTQDLNSHYYFSCPSAAQRRFPYIMIPSVKAQYCVDGVLDTALVPPAIDGKYPDLWDIKVLKVRPGAHVKDMAITSTVLHTSDIIEFLDWYTRAIKEFDCQQGIVKASVENMRSVSVCEVCKFIRCHCRQEGLSESFEYFNTSIQNFCRWFIIFVIVHDIAYFSVVQCIPVLYEMLYNMQLRIANRYAQDLLQWQRTRLANFGRTLLTRYRPAYAMAAFAALYTAYKLYRLAQGEPQTREDVGVKPAPGAKERANVWYKDDFELSAYDLNPVITSSKGLDMGDFISVISKSVAYANISTTLKDKNHMVLTCLKGNYYLTNNHHFPILDGAHKLNIVFQSGKDGVTTNQTMYITETQLYRLPDHDLCILRLPAMPPRKGVYKYIPENLANCKNNGFYIIRDENGSVITPSLSVIKPAKSDVVKGFTGNLWSAYSSVVTARGNCGSPMIATTGLGYVWIGIHQLGNGMTSWVGANALNKNWIDSIIGGKTLISGEPMLVAQTATTAVGPLHHKSVFRYIEDGSAEVYGSFVGNRSKGRSRVCATNIQHLITDFGIPVSFTKPELNSYEPWRIAALDMTHVTQRMDTDVIATCVDNFVADILSSDVDLSTLNVYDDFTAVNGAAGVSYVDKINRNTSAGFPWRKSKKHFLKRVPPKFGLQDPVEVDPEIMDRVQIMVDTYHSGSTVSPVFSAHLKDEPVTFSKAERKKTRVFAGAPFDWTIIVRKYFLSSIRLIQNNREVFESAPGTVAQSYEWHDLHTYLTQHGADRMVAGDFASYDKTMSAVFILAAFDVLIRLARASKNFSEDDLKVMNGIAHDVAYPTMDFNGDLVRFFGSNPSGHPLTVIINGLVNSLYMRYCYFMLNPNHEALTFKKNVSLMTYGDDNIMGVSVRVTWFNHTTIAKVLASMDIVYTMPDKAAKSIPYVDIKDCSFLKRSWRFDAEVGAYLAALEIASINKMLTVWVRSKNVSEEVQIESVMSSAIREAFYHGREVYEAMREMLACVIEDANLEMWVTPTTLPTWQQLYEDFWNNSRTLNCVPTSMVQTLDEQGFDSMSKPKLSLNTSYCWAHQYCCATRLECGVLRNIPERSSKPLFRGGTGVLPKAHALLSQSLSRLESSNRLTNNRTSDHSEDLLQHTLYDVVENNGNDAQGANVHTDLSVAQGFKLQSLEQKVTNAANNEQQEIMHFSDEVAGDVMEIPAPINYVMSEGAVNAELGDFLSRPVEITRVNWIEGTGINTSFKPWELYFDLPSIQKKLDNYYLLQANLRIKVVINASPFYYGALLAAYQPLSLFNPAPIVSAAGGEDMVLYSQRPHIDIYPQNCQGGEMVLPFVYHKEWLNITSRANLQDMGTINLRSYVNLLNCNGAVGAGVDIVFYAWAENLRLAGPTTKLSLQGKKTKDEYDEEGVISKPASAISRAAGSLSDIPVIGPFMTATSAVTGTIASLANVLGFTNPPNLADVHAFKSNAFPVLATTDISIPFEKLTLDAKNELSIDPRICGADLGDELLISNFCKRECWLRSVVWSSTTLTTDDVFNMQIRPCQARSRPVTGSQNVFSSPMMHAAQLFKHWRGDIKVRIKVICTMYHKGRLRISYDPVNAMGSNINAESQSLVYTHILDIAEENDVTFNIPYVQDVAYCKVAPFVDTVYYGNNGGSSTLAHLPGISNGTLSISPLSVLTSPVTPSSVHVMVYVSAGDNFELANPTVLDNRCSYYQVQSKVTYTSKPGDVLYLGDHCSMTDDNINLVYMGETTLSLRPLLHRTSLLGMMADAGTANPTYGIASYIKLMARRPRFPGFDLDGQETAVGIVSTTNEPYNWVAWTAMTWLEPCFVGQRGSINWVINPQQQRDPRTSFTFNREQNSQLGIYYLLDQHPDTKSHVAKGYLNQGPRGMPGMSANSQPVQNTIHANVPFYGNVKFQTTSANARNLGIAADESDYDAIRCVTTFSPVNATEANSTGFSTYYVGAGADYNLIFFLNVPVIYRYSTIPAAV